jgi:hypothetical protein
MDEEEVVVVRLVKFPSDQEVTLLSPLASPSSLASSQFSLNTSLND